MPTADKLGVTNVQQIVTDIFGIEGRQRGDEMDILCPDPAHADTHPSASVNLDSGLWKCLACGKAGDLLSLGSLALSEPKEAISRLLQPSTPEAILASVQRKLLNTTATKRRHNPPLNLPGPYDDGPLDELVERGFTLDTLRRWGVRYAESQKLPGKTQEFIIHRSIALPIKDERGTLLAWCYRRTNASPSWQPRYLYTPDAPLSDMWFGVHMYNRAEQVVVVEGALDAIWLDQAGIPALALLGSAMAERKLQYLRRYPSIVLFGDRDAAGVAAVNTIGKVLGNEMPVRVARYIGRTDAKDPQELAPIDVELAIEAAIPWNQWVLAQRQPIR